MKRTENFQSIENIENISFLPQKIDQLDMEKQYRQLMFVYEAAIELIVSKLNILKGEFQFSNDRNPISGISSRVKSKESIIYKIHRKGLPMTGSTLVQSVRDVAGVRVVCPFIEDVYYVARTLIKHNDIELLEVKDYIRNPKKNGYRSLHLIITVNVNFAEFSHNVPVEIQIRTIAMDFWASTEHQLRYKKDKEFPKEVQDKLKRCADIMAEADGLMQDIAGDFESEEEQW